MKLIFQLPHTNYSREFFWENLYYISTKVHTFIDRKDLSQNYCSNCNIQHRPNVICLPDFITRESVDTLLDLVGIPIGNHPYNLCWLHHDVLNFFKLCHTLGISENFLCNHIASALNLESVFLKGLAIPSINELYTSNYQVAAKLMTFVLYKVTETLLNRMIPAAQRINELLDRRNQLLQHFGAEFFQNYDKMISRGSNCDR